MFIKLLLANFTPLLTLAALSNEIASFAGVLRRNVAHCIRTYRFLRDLSSTSPVISMIIQLTLRLNRRRRVKISILFITRWPYMIACRRPSSHGEPRVDALTIVHFFAWFVHDSPTFSSSSETVDNQMLLYFFTIFVFLVLMTASLMIFCYTSFELASHTLCAISTLKYIYVWVLLLIKLKVFFHPKHFQGIIKKTTLWKNLRHWMPSEGKKCK